MGDDGGGLLISPDGVAPSRMVSVSASVIPLHHKSPEDFFLAPAHPGSHRKRAAKWLDVCVYEYVNFVMPLLKKELTFLLLYAFSALS